MKKLNNKGFTLIELLAVIVILAVVMGIAASQVLSAMNNSRKGSLQDSAKAVAQAFQTRYSEALVMNEAGTVYKGVITDGYDFTSSAVKEIDSGLNNELNISTSSYDLGSAATAPTATNVTKSFISFDGKDFVACMIAKKTGGYYVSTAATKTTVTVHGTTYTFPTGTMWACSLDNANSWSS